MIEHVSTPAALRRAARGWPLWVGLAVVLAAGTAVKVACTSGGLVGSELGSPGC